MKCTDKSLDLLEGLYNMCFISLDALEAIPVSFTCAITPVIVTSLRCKAQNMSGIISIILPEAPPPWWRCHSDIW